MKLLLFAFAIWMPLDYTTEMAVEQMAIQSTTDVDWSKCSSTASCMKLCLAAGKPEQLCTDWTEYRRGLEDGRNDREISADVGEDVHENYSRAGLWGDAAPDGNCELGYWHGFDGEDGLK